MTLVCVVLTCDNLDYINDTRTVLDFGYDNFTHYTLKNDKKGKSFRCGNASKECEN